MNQQLIFKDKAKVSSVLLFADEPPIFLPKRCSIKILRYKTKQEAISREFLDGQPITVEGCLYNLIYQAVEKVKAIIEGVKKLGPNGLEEISYPSITLHEIITNAVIHRDYSIAADIQIRIYDDRIEIQSPGRLAGHVTPKNILDTQCARNPQIVRLISKFPNPPNKDAGEGLNVAFEAMTNLRLKEPDIIEKDESVLVLIRHEPLGSPEEIVMDYLKSNSEITNSIGRDLTGLKDANNMKDIFLRLKRSGLIEPVPGKKGNKSAWRKTT
jgi:ATP-dependent DNA helicase RecG